MTRPDRDALAALAERVEREEPLRIGDRIRCKREATVRWGHDLGFGTIIDERAGDPPCKCIDFDEGGWAWLRCDDIERAHAADGEARG